MHDNWWGMLQDDKPPKSSWRPRKSTKSRDQLSVKKIHKSHTVTEKGKGPSRGKIGPTEPRGVEDMYQNSRCASREKTSVQSTKKLYENWDAISPVFLSAALRKNFSSYRTTNKHGETRYRLNCHEDRCNRKRIHTHFLKNQNCEMQEGQNFLDTMQETHRWSHTSSSKSWENWSKNKARSLNWDLWIGKQSPMRCRGTKFGSWKIRDETKTSWSRLGSQKSSTLTILGIWRYSAKFTMEQ